MAEPRIPASLTTDKSAVGNMTMSASVTALEAKARFGKLLERVAMGEKIVITRYGKQVARIIPAYGRDLREVRQAVAGLRALRRSIAERRDAGAVPDDVDVKALIEEGRR